MNAVEEYRKERLRRGPDVDGLTADAAIAELEAALAERDKELLRSDKALEDAAGALEVCDVTLAEWGKFEDAVRGVCFDHNSVDMSGKVRWAETIPVRSVMRHIFDFYSSEPLTPDGTVPGACAGKKP